MSSTGTTDGGSLGSSYTSIGSSSISQPHPRIPSILVGRERELGIVEEAYMSSARGSVWIGGSSGSGKTALVAEFCRQRRRKGNVLVARGKWDQLTRTSTPYAALVDAMKELCQQIQECEWMPLMMSRLLEQEEMGATVRILSRFLPQLNVMMVGEQHNPQETQRQTLDDHQGEGGDENSFTGLKIAIRTFLLLVTSYQSVMLVMDDLQWADEATLQVLSFVLQQPQTSHPHQLFLVGCYRSNEVHKDNALEVALAQLDPQAYTRIPELPNLSLEDVNLLLCERLRMEPEDSGPARQQQLALVVHDKTHGNPFFVLQFLDAMMQRGILTKS
eukprot:Sro2765_g336640.2  (330) ;mRNA; f:6381-7371